VVLDVDVRHGGEASLEQLEATYDRLPETLTAQSGGGGRHLYFQHPGPRIPNIAQLEGYPGLDVRGDGGYIVAPPSLHQSGKQYLWVDAAHVLEALPPWLCELMTPRAHAAQTAPGVLSRLPVVPAEEAEGFWLGRALARAQPGTRNVTGYWLACRLRDAGVRVDAAEAILRRYAAQVAAGDHPYHTHEALASLRSAYQRSADEPPA
jgi:hypothetical protein